MIEGQKDDGKRERDSVRVQDQPREKCLEGLTAKLPLTLPSLLSMPLFPSAPELHVSHHVQIPLL